MKYFLIVNLFAGLILTQATGRCEKIHVRKEIRDLTSQEREDFFNAILSINSGSRPTPLDRLTRIHVDNSDSIHTNPVFLPWHRHFLHLAEQEMRKNYPNLVIPYWDWARDSQAPERSEIFTNSYFGGTGTAQTNWCVSSGRFKDFRVITTDDGNQEHCLRRSFNKGNKISAFVSVEGIDKVKRENKNYDRFAQRLEGSPHALPHTFIGGDYGDISSMSSPNDPIFWVHHGMIDKIWADWQVENGEEGKKYHSRRSDTDPLPYYQNVQVRQVLDTSQYPLCYVYAGQPIPKSNETTTETTTTAPQTQSSTISLPQTTTNQSIDTQSSIASSTTQQSIVTPSTTQQPIFTPSTTEPIFTPSTTEPIFTSSTTQPIFTSSTTQPIFTPTNTQPIFTPTFTQPQVTNEPTPTRQPSPPGGRPGRDNNFFINGSLLRTILESLGFRVRRRGYYENTDENYGEYPKKNNKKYPTKPKYPTEPKNPIVNIEHEGQNLAIDLTSIIQPNALLQQIEQICPKTLCPSSEDRDNKVKLRIPEPVGLKWLQMNRYPVEQFREQELEYAQELYKFNSDPNYISSASIKKRFESKYQADEEEIVKKTVVKKVVYY